MGFLLATTGLLLFSLPYFVSSFSYRISKFMLRHQEKYLQIVFETVLAMPYICVLVPVFGYVSKYVISIYILQK